MKKYLLTTLLFSVLSGGAQAQTCHPTIETFYENGKPTDNWAQVYLPFGVFVSYARCLGVQVNVPDGEGGFTSTGTVTLRINNKSYPADYAGPAPFFFNFQQVNIFVPPDEVVNGATVYLRICDLAGNCVNSSGATLRR